MVPRTGPGVLPSGDPEAGVLPRVSRNSVPEYYSPTPSRQKRNHSRANTKKPGDLPPIEKDKEEREIKRVDVDSSSQSEPMDEDADVHPHCTRIRAAQNDSQFDNLITKEEEAVF